MDIQKELNKTTGFKNLALLASQVVEGFISGMHKSPFHGFSAEFAEHKIYNPGESTRHIDWKLFAKTDKLYTKRYDEETNLRCHLIIDNSPSMHYPSVSNQQLGNLNKVGYSALAAASVMSVLKKQRDAVGLSVYSDSYEYYAPEKGSDRHHNMLLDQLSKMVVNKPKGTTTNTYKYLHEIAEKMKRRSLIFLFTDMFQSDVQEKELFEALRHLKYNKHDVVLFHTYDSATEVNFDFTNKPARYTDVETGEHIDLYADNVKEVYKKAVSAYFEKLRVRCGQNRIKYMPVDIQRNFDVVLTTFLLERQLFK
ncbi:hypothetical protein JCM19275_476 [Nonlabens ulvanivorans]|uniref:DUF58 domain-containing protein n=1 Tax=Nonlabens ulvanivorans TaxID=906888 RepID=A0A090WE66_NONUL|nr:DUF58 domain-containing protein [Nonlabens ulvanivorans]WOI22677.1 DUF58 domain-containing protein [Nonlabens ulvanivorans]GAL75315.1 hypothetical protein JCM19275_476 [Nonlabens ulvanivorans]